MWKENFNLITEWSLLSYRGKYLISLFEGSKRQSFVLEDVRFTQEANFPIMRVSNDHHLCNSVVCS